MMKGFATIELTDEVTGEKKVIHESNMVTNGFSQFFKRIGNATMPMANTDYNISNTTEFVYSLFGGIFLFNDVVEEDPNNLIIPTNVDCTGYASNITDVTTNDMCGVFNQSESGVQEDGSYRFVWDFLTSQANGTIASVCLVPTAAGRLGWNTKMASHSSAVSNAGAFDLGAISDLRYINPKIDYILYFDDIYLYCVKKYNLAYDGNNKENHISVSGKFVIGKYLYTNKTVGIKSSYSDIRLVETIEIEMPEEFMTYIGTGTSFYSGSVYDNGCVYLFCKNSDRVNAGDILKICKIDISDFSVQIISITNTTEYWWIFEASSYVTTKIAVANGKLLVSAYGRQHTFIIDLSNPTDIKEIFMDDGITALPTAVFGSTLDKYVFCAENISASNGKNYIINTDSGIAHKFNISNTRNMIIPSESSGRYDYSCIASHLNNCFYKINKCSTYSYYNATMIPYVLMTINNLDAPVTKTASQSMKITYTLQEIAE